MDDGLALVYPAFTMIGGLGVQAPWLAVAIIATLGGYASYLAGLGRHQVQPSRASWLIWSGTTTCEAATYAALNPGTLQEWVFVLSAVACAAVTLKVWHRSAWVRPDAGEIICVAACAVALGLWIGFRSAFWAHMLVVAALPVSFWPTWRSVAVDRDRERSPAWGLWTVGDLAALLVATHGAHRGVAELAYLLVELTCHASVWLMIGLVTINPLRSLRPIARRRATRYQRDRFQVSETHLGKAVFAAAEFTAGETIIEFTGRRFRADRVPSLMRGRSDRFVQVTPDHYMGPSGRIDDLINHSCAPNAGLRFTASGVFLVAIRAIGTGEEIAWDYSTTLAESNWHMICQCRAPECRRVIGNFASLSDERQEWFRSHNMVAPYLRRRDAVRRPRAA